MASVVAMTLDEVVKALGKAASLEGEILALDDAVVFFEAVDLFRAMDLFRAGTLVRGAALVEKAVC